MIKIHRSDGDVCPICLDMIRGFGVKTICNHHFHRGCFELLKRYSDICPLCRTTLPPDNKYIPSINKDTIINTIPSIFYILEFAFIIGGLVCPCSIDRIMSFKYLFAVFNLYVVYKFDI